MVFILQTLITNFKLPYQCHNGTIMNLVTGLQVNSYRRRDFPIKPVNPISHRIVLLILRNYTISPLLNCTTTRKINLGVKKIYHPKCQYCHQMFWVTKLNCHPVCHLNLSAKVLGDSFYISSHKTVRT